VSEGHNQYKLLNGIVQEKSCKLKLKIHSETPIKSKMSDKHIFVLTLFCSIFRINLLESIKKVCSRHFSTNNDLVQIRSAVYNLFYSIYPLLGGNWQKFLAINTSLSIFFKSCKVYDRMTKNCPSLSSTIL
jgi:hypothetical protein